MESTANLGSRRVGRGGTRVHGGRSKVEYSGARMQPLTRGPEADETKTMTVAWPHHACVPLSKWRQHRPARWFDLCGCIQRALLATRRQHTVCKSRNSFADALFTQGLMALIQLPIICCDSADHLLCEGAVCTRVCDRVLNIGGATPHRSVTEAVWLRAPRRSVHVGGRLADIAAKPHSHHPGHFRPYIPFKGDGP